MIEPFRLLVVVRTRGDVHHVTSEVIPFYVDRDRQTMISRLKTYALENEHVEVSWVELPS
jgi:hypothetical protein